MKKRSMMLMSAALALTAVLSGCGGAKDNNAANSPGASSPAGESPKKNVTIKMFQFKVEIAEQLQNLVNEYEKETGVKVQIETVGGGADYGAALKAKFNSGDKPDIFNNGGFSDLDLWLENLEDLSDQPWVKDLVKGTDEPMTHDGKLYGMPIGVEGYGFIYNKDLFAKAGITELPKTLSQLEDAAKKLQDNGITPFINGYGEWWVLGNHFVNLPFAYQADPNAFIAGLNDGSQKIPGNEVFENWTKLFDLTVKYGGKNPLQTDYNTQVTEFATGKAAMTQQGNWTQVQISKTNPDVNIGFLPMPISEDAAANDKLFVGVPNNWVVNKNSAVKEEAKAFLNWMVTSDTGKRFITQEFKFIPALTTISATEEDLGALASDIMKYNQEGKVLSWNWFKFPQGEASSKKFGDSMQGYVGGQLTKEKMLEAFQSTWDSLKK
ncbi:ABC transporter substrate-binding protein [Cohnella sp. CIP 111063]|uniref:ABC transporter substrate-binding protein n=1 Tax=unclassified Cohnella TaxID=2636738 RepID=UPI000B8BCABD|nr:MULTISPECIES: ABC transporter substrate-binding protein [unclassified Cohnella]OXS54301.1 ABC transporter substrate-binding protein [Cohnella sp. CIP 111063]PRX63496.1 carbohydrate ABC transporter substrate-binding protein (CUT1 family) [Cohnella sp. SGD-V74]